MNITAPSIYPDAHENLIIGVGEHLSDVTKRAVSCRTENSSGGEGGLGISGGGGRKCAQRFHSPRGAGRPYVEAVHERRRWARDIIIIILILL